MERVAVDKKAISLLAIILYIFASSSPESNGK